MIDLSDLLMLCFFSFLAGFIDAIIGGGGLVQTPATLLILPYYPVPMILGTTKVPSMAGSFMGAYQYSRHVQIIRKVLIPVCVIAFVSSLAGSYTVSVIPNSFMKPLAFFILIGVAIYTYRKKNFGVSEEAKELSFRTQLTYGALMGLLLGFYDGFFGPGTGSFLVLCFITLIGFDFLKASAHAKMVNLATNLASVLYFSFKNLILFKVAIPMAVCNMTGAFFGARLAILKGNKFIRIFFLCVVSAIILRFGYDLFLKEKL
jgi:uncharacterized protein